MWNLFNVNYVEPMTSKKLFIILSIYYIIQTFSFGAMIKATSSTLVLANYY